MTIPAARELWQHYEVIQTGPRSRQRCWNRCTTPVRAAGDIPVRNPVGLTRT